MLTDCSIERDMHASSCIGQVLGGKEGCPDILVMTQNGITWGLTSTVWKASHHMKERLECWVYVEIMLRADANPYNMANMLGVVYNTRVCWEPLLRGLGPRGIVYNATCQGGIFLQHGWQKISFSCKLIHKDFSCVFWAWNVWPGWISHTGILAQHVACAAPVVWYHVVAVASFPFSGKIGFSKMSGVPSLSS